MSATKDMYSCWKCGKRPRLVSTVKHIGTACPHTVRRAIIKCRNKRCDARSKKTMDIQKAKDSWNERALRGDA